VEIFGSVVKESAKNDRVLVLSIEVEDTGIGISKGASDIILDPFSWLSSRNLGKYSGCDSGLTFVKKIIRELYGEIDVKSVFNKGSVFQVLILCQTSLVDIDTPLSRGKSS